MDLITDADMEDYGFEYSDEEPEEQDVDIENQYYNTKGVYDERLWSHRSCLHIACDCLDFGLTWSMLRSARWGDGCENWLTEIVC